MSRRSKSRMLRKIGWLVFLMILASSAFWLPLIIIKSTSSLETLDAMESALIVTVKIVTALFFVAVGSSIGSFVNVLAYRMPIGKSVVFNPSSCPRCNSRIKLWHNVPIFGWLMLGGRCYVCKLPISARYPLIELWFGLFFLILFYVELATGTLNIPETRDYFVRSISAIVWQLDKESIGLYTFHCFLLCTLSTWTLFKIDRNRIPVLAVVVPIILGVIAVSIWPFLHPVSWFRGSGIDILERGMGRSLMNAACGLLDGIAIGAAIEWLFREKGNRPFTFKGLMWGMGIVGLFLGWQALYSAIGVFGLIFFGVRILSIWSAWHPVPIMGVWTLAVLVQLCCWKLLSQINIWPGTTNNDWETVLINVIVSLGTAILMITLTNLFLPLNDTFASELPTDEE